MIDVSHHINAVRRQVGTRVLEAGEAKVVTLTRTFATDVDDLWDACTNPERLPRWFAPVRGELRLGGRYAIEGNASGVVERCDPPKSFAATWEFGGQTSWVDVRFEPDDDGARLVLEHIAHVDDHWERFGPGAVGIGWELGLLGLAGHLGAAGVPTPAEGEAWLTSDAGHDYVVRSSEAWADAQVAAGADPAAARAAAARTAAFYTGAPEPTP